MPASYASKIALIGAGPASLSCATFLARLGYSDITIFEKHNFAGGLAIQSIPEFRFLLFGCFLLKCFSIPAKITQAEVHMVQELGVKFAYGKELGKDFSIANLKKQGYVVFVGVGLPKVLVVFLPLFDCSNRLSLFLYSRSLLLICTHLQIFLLLCPTQSEKITRKNSLNFLGTSLCLAVAMLLSTLQVQLFAGNILIHFCSKFFIAEHRKLHLPIVKILPA